MEKFEDFKLRYLGLIFLLMLSIEILFAVLKGVIPNTVVYTVNMTAWLVFLPFFYLFFKKRNYNFSDLYKKNYSSSLNTLDYGKILFSLFFINLFGSLVSQVILFFMPGFIQEYFARRTELIMNSEVFQFGSQGIYFEIIRILSIIIIAPLIEELLFRGALFQRLKYKFNINIAIITSAILFGLGHADLISKFVYGFVFTIIVLETKSLRASTILHFANNLIATIIAYSFQSLDFKALSSEEFINDFGVYLNIFSILIIVCMVISIKYLYEFVKAHPVRNYEKTNIM